MLRSVAFRSRELTRRGTGTIHLAGALGNLRGNFTRMFSDGGGGVRRGAM
jgi:hypothetical protein